MSIYFVLDLNELKAQRFCTFKELEFLKTLEAMKDGLYLILKQGDFGDKVWKVKVMLFVKLARNRIVVPDFYCLLITTENYRGKNV